MASLPVNVLNAVMALAVGRSHRPLWDSDWASDMMPRMRSKGASSFNEPRISMQSDDMGASSWSTYLLNSSMGRIRLNLRKGVNDVKEDLAVFPVGCLPGHVMERRQGRGELVPACDLDADLSDVTVFLR
jgi:hypothetical protein